MVLAGSKGFRKKIGSRQRLGVIVNVKNDVLNLAFKEKNSHGFEAKV